MKPTNLAVILAILFSSQLVASEQGSNGEAVDIEHLSVIGVRQRLEQAGTLANTIMKTEVISASMIENKNAVNLSEAIDNSPGVKVSNECSMCGVKRIMLNGMKGEQTTILVDGLPVHTMISGYYAVDAIPTTGIGAIEVARGAGASLIAPEAIGGTINIISYEPTENGAELDISAGENGYRKLGFLGKGVSEDGATRATLVAQYDDRDQFDADNNKVNEAPQQENRSLTGRVSHDITDFDNLVLRFANIQSEIFGGPMLGSAFADGSASSIGNVLSGYDDQFSEPQHLFEDGDVRKPFTGKAWETTEWIKTERNEASLVWLREFNDDWNMHLAASYAEHKQDSFYEGFDYVAGDKMWFFDVRFNHLLNDDQLLTFGADLRTEKMRSHSRTGSTNPDYVSDSFDYDVKGLYLQDTWQATQDLEIAMALRYDTITADFTDPNKPGIELDESILSPRVDVRLRHNDQWTSRLSAGRGYRAPLSFFETDHGILDGSLGFDIDIDELERSNSANYALSYDNGQFTSTASVAWTEVEHLAALTTNEHGIPLLTQLDEKASVITSDIALGYRLTDELTINVTGEHFNYDSVFKSSYAVAPIEERVTLTLDWDIKDWELFANLVWVGSRDLSEYGYEGYNRLDANGQVDPDSKKASDAPSYVTLDLRVNYQFNDYMSLYSGVSNLFDYTQAGNEESPLFYDADGAFDVGYIYGPLRGREIYAGMKLAF
ncbi:TonB-dependent receptor plug domain-containing protein [Shewanella algidipiscicola]|uniref:TonB-dependent receptor n=1 Tax=Shewanella algidipiscicola TaxID=614070 RepID=A0ABQ4P4W3_9GAMM|nr:TonB-dependent receptor [Shewanella algidipiscicola]GIU42528.1 TonB-dependent receptor [Shewanella algidipiscicola]